MITNIIIITKIVFINIYIEENYIVFVYYLNFT